MPRFCVNKNAQSTGEHEVHNLDANCSYLPEAQNQHSLGTHATCQPAVTDARTVYPNVDGCAYCAPDCHTRQETVLSVSVDLCE